MRNFGPQLRIVTMQMTQSVVIDMVTADLSAQLAVEGFPAAAVGMAQALTSAAYHVAVTGGHTEQHAAVSSHTVHTLRHIFQVRHDIDTGHGQRSSECCDIIRWQLHFTLRLHECLHIYRS